MVRQAIYSYSKNLSDLILFNYHRRHHRAGHCGAGTHQRPHAAGTHTPLGCGGVSVQSGELDPGVCEDFHAS